MTDEQGLMYYNPTQDKYVSKHQPMPTQKHRSIQKMMEHRWILVYDKEHLDIYADAPTFSQEPVSTSTLLVQRNGINNNHNTTIKYNKKGILTTYENARRPSDDKYKNTSTDMPNMI